ncbi:MAG TPA: hypothetical protein ENH85_01945 [Candidatus Scalindua sp.]|nr:hypothetical protein [Candidatus Scalindua sp.]
MSKEIIIDHKDIATPDGITPHIEKEFKKHDLDLHVNEVEDIEDDFKAGKRRLRVKNTKYFFMPKAP